MNVEEVFLFLFVSPFNNSFNKVMKNTFSFRRLIRVLSVAFVSVSIIAVLFASGMSPGPLQMFEILFSGTAALTCCCLPHENHLRHAVCSGSILLTSAVLLLVNMAPLPFVLMISGCLAASHVLFIYEKYRQARFFFCNIAVWHNIEDGERSVLVIASLLEAMLFLASLSRSDTVQWMVTALAATGFILLYLYLYFGWYMLVGKQTRAEIKRNLRGRLQPVAPARNEEETRRMESLFGRIKDLMEDKRPYLDPDLSETAMATMVFSNQNYLSRTVNTMSNLNFKQFLNSYRVQYAEDLMRKDPRMQVKEIASLSGFNSTPSFNMAFKFFKGMTPGRYMKEMYQQEAPMDHEHRSNLPGKEQ